LGKDSEKGRQKMAGIVAIGVHIPVYRLSREEIARAWGGRGGGGEKAVAGYDEDAITMAVNASIDCLKQTACPVDGLFFTTTSAPYREKLSATVMAMALDLPRECRTADYADSLRAPAIAMSAAVDAVKSGSARNVIVAASDHRTGAARSKFEQELGDGAAALLIGGENVIASIDGSYSIYNEMFDVWRVEGEAFLRSGEERFIISEGYQKTMQEAISGLLRKYRLAPADFTRVILAAPDDRAQAALARSLGFDVKTQLQDSLYGAIGNTGSAAPFIMLADTLETAKPGEKILLAIYGEGVDAFLLTVTSNITGLQRGVGIKGLVSRKTSLTYEKYATWRGLIVTEAARLGGAIVPSAAALWRDRKAILAFYGVKCKKCGTPQYPPTRICAVCRSKDNFEDYRFADKRGQIFTYAIDYMAVTENPPGINAFVDFNGGGRILCEITDCDPKIVRVSLPVEMTFRRFSANGGIMNYSWKARPVV
jgi:hydroxymethylglutaryl-CoA synthase